MKVFNFLLILLFTTLNLYSQQTPLYWMDDSQYPAKLRPVTFSNPLPIKITNQLDTNKLPFLNKDNTFTGTNYFRKLIADTVTINNIARANSTYWINGTDTLGWVDAARSDVVFFPQMKVGTLQTNTTVAENFIRSNQVQTDTLISHSPLIIAGDTTIARKIFADSLMTQKVKAGNILINGVDNSINGANIIYTNILSANSILRLKSNLAHIEFYSGGQLRFYVTASGHFEPVYNKLFNLGSPTMYFNNTYTSILNSDTLKSMFLKSIDDLVLVAGNGKGVYIKDNNGTALRYSFSNLGIYNYSNNSYDIGNATNKFKNLYLGTCLYSPTATFSEVPNFTDNDNATVGGLTAGQIYRDNNGILRIVY